VVRSAGSLALDAAEMSARRLLDAGSLDEAEAMLRRVLDRAPNRAWAWFLLGRVRYAKGDGDAAIDLLRKAVALDPKLAPAYNDLGIFLLHQGRLEEAEACCRRAVELDGRLAECMTNLGAVLAARGRLEDASSWYARAIAADGQSAPAHNNLGAALVKLDRPDEAEALHRRAIALKPDFPDAHYNLGVALHDQGRFADALACYDKAVVLKPELVDARWNRAFSLLLAGNYADGWREHEWRWRRKEQPPRSFPQPLWHGEPLEGRSILLHAEQGIGDTLQFMRYVPLVVARGARVVLQVQRPALRLAAVTFQGMTQEGTTQEGTTQEGTTQEGMAQVIGDGDVPPPFDLHCPLLSLPLAFGTTLDAVPAEVPYLAADPVAVARWRERLATAAGLKVGLVWAGSPQHKNDRNRSIAFDRLAPLFAIRSISWFSLQVGERAGDLAGLAAGAVTDLSPALSDFSETAAAVAALDLVIVVDTAVAHLAGALGKPVWIMLPHVADWRWLIGRDDSPWYPTARLFRQPARGDWESVALCVRRALEERAGVSTMTQTEASRRLADANVMLRAGDLDGAERALAALLAIDGTQGRAWHMRGIIAQRRNDHAAAAVVFRRALALDPGTADAQNNLGVTLGALGRRDDAIACYRRALALQPDYAKAHLNLGAALMIVDAVEADKHLRQAIAIDPGFAEVHYNLGNLRETQKAYHEAAASFRRAIDLKPEFYDAHNNLGAALLKAGDAAAALASFERAAALRPDHAEAHHNLANALCELGRYADALAGYRRAVGLDPEHVQANFSAALIQLLRGDLREGFKGYEWRWRLATLPPRALSAPLWNGEDLAGRTILLHAEQGYGDTILGLRYVPLVAARGGSVMLEVPQPLMRLAQRLPGVAQVVARGATLPPFELHCPLLSLARTFGTTLETIPAETPYLEAPAEALTRWRSRLGPGSGLKVGLVWAGSSQHRSDELRSIPLEMFLPLLRLQGSRWFSLQVGERSADLQRMPDDLVTDLSGQFTDFAETAAAICNLDLVIAVDTAVAHLAGALGRPVWVLVRSHPDWRWLLDRDDSPWYPTLRLFRQRALGDWRDVIRDVRDVLEGQIGGEAASTR
jgi:tetratricopeptide (TPR) repeat protein